MEKYMRPARAGWKWEVTPAPRFRPFETVPEKILLAVYTAGMLVLFIMGK